MAFNSIFLYPNPGFPAIIIPKHKLSSSSSSSSSFRIASQSEGAEGGVTVDNLNSTSSGPLSSARTQLDLLEQLTSVDGYESDGSSKKLTIRDQLAQLVGDRDDDFSIPLGKNLKKVNAKFLTVSQKRNIKRQTYLNEVSRRNDTNFFATIGAFVILPPIIILGIAILTGYGPFISNQRPEMLKREKMRIVREFRVRRSSYETRMWKSCWMLVVGLV